MRKRVSLIFLDASNEDHFKKSAFSYFYAYVKIDNDSRFGGEGYFKCCVKDRVCKCIKNKQIFL